MCAYNKSDRLDPSSVLAIWKWEMIEKSIASRRVGDRSMVIDYYSHPTKCLWGLAVDCAVGPLIFCCIVGNCKVLKVPIAWRVFRRSIKESDRSIASNGKPCSHACPKLFPDPVGVAGGVAKIKLACDTVLLTGIPVACMTWPCHTLHLGLFLSLSWNHIQVLVLVLEPEVLDNITVTYLPPLWGKIVNVCQKKISGSVNGD